MKRLVIQNGFLRFKRGMSSISKQHEKNMKNKSIISCEKEGVRVSPLLKKSSQLLDTFEGGETVFECFQRGLSISGEKELLGWRPSAKAPYKWLTYNQVDRRSKAFGDGLINIGVEPGNETRIGIYSQNCPEYFISEMGFLHHTICTVPFYNNLEMKNLEFIANHASLKTIVVDTYVKLKSLMNIRSDLPKLERVIVYEPVQQENRKQAEDLGLQVHNISEVEELGAKNPLPSKLPKPDDVYIVCFTSGTTGVPKGVILKHYNLCMVVGGICEHMEEYGILIDKSDVFLSYLPLAHIYERFNQAACIFNGGKIGYFHGDPKKIIDDCEELKPTVFPAVPRLLTRVHDKVFGEVCANPLKKFILKKAMDSKKKDLEKGIISNNTIWDKLIFYKMQAKLGGRVRFISCGSAPLSSTVLTDIRCMFGCIVVEGYGSTECSGIATLSIPGDPSAGHVGSPLPCTSIKLIDRPEMNYLVKKNQGEICIKGPTIFDGYLNNEVKTKEALTEDKWLLTGDIGQWMPDGALKIIDRRKHLFKLSQGEFIAPEKIENILLLCPYLMQVFVYGDGHRDSLVCIAVVDPETIPSLGKQLSVPGSIDTICAHKKVKEDILKQLRDLSRNNGLSNLEVVRNVYLTTEEFTVHNGLLTPTFKMKRTFLQNRYNPIIDEMYNEINGKKVSNGFD